MIDLEKLGLLYTHNILLKFLFEGHTNTYLTDKEIFSLSFGL